MFTSRHFVAIAKILREGNTPEQTAEAMADFLATTNPRFDRAAFLAAAQKREVQTMSENKRWFGTIEHMKVKVKHSGSHFFDRDTLRFFSSRVLETLYGTKGRVFVTSERRDDNEPRYFTVRIVERDGDDRLYVTTVGPFCALSSHQAKLLAGLVGRADSKGLLPDETKYGQLPALANALGFKTSDSTDGWTFSMESGFSHE